MKKQNPVGAESDAGLGECRWTAVWDYDVCEDWTECGETYVPGGFNWTEDCPSCGKPIKRVDA